MTKYLRCIRFILVVFSLIPTAYAVEIERVSVSSSGVQGSRSSFVGSTSADGRFVAFSSVANNLVVGDTNGDYDIFVHDRDLNVTELVSVSSGGAQSNDNSGAPSISADGRFVAFVSDASNLVVGDTNRVSDIFVHDRDLGLTERVSVSTSGVQGRSRSEAPSISADGRFVAFRSRAKNLVADDTTFLIDIFVRDRDLNVTERVSVSSAGVQGNDNSGAPSISADGRFVAFDSYARNLVVGDTNRRSDIFVHDRDLNVTERVSMSSTGEQGNWHSFSPSISADGRFVAFTSYASNLVVGDTTGRSQSDVFVHDRDLNVTELVSISSARVQDEFSSFSQSISADGRFVAFDSYTRNLVVGDTNGASDVFVYENDLLNQTYDLTVSLRATSGATQAGDYIRFRALLKNNGNTTLTQCKVLFVNPLVTIQRIREFNFSTWPIKAANPVKNGSIDIAPGETGQFNLAVLPHVAMRREVGFDYVCDNTKALPISFINTVHLTAKTEPLIAEDFVQLKNSNKRTELIIDRSNGNYWTGYAAKVSNTGSEVTSVNLSTTSFLPGAILRQSQLCEPLDPANNNWTCINPRDTQLQVDLAPGESKKILVYVHARESIEKRVIKNRIYLEARDGAGEVVAKTSMGISTIN